jgi:hypothetical protein
MKTKDLFFAGIIALILLCGLSPLDAAEETEARREQLRQEAQTSYAEITQSLNAIFEKANLNQRPDDAMIKRAAECLEKNRRNAVVYDSTQKTGYMLLQSWVSYYQNDPVSNLNWATRACREDPSNGDAWISQTLFSYIYGRRPIEPQPARPQRQQPAQRQQSEQRQLNEQRRQRPQPRGRNADAPVEMAPVSTPDAPFGRSGALDFDLNSLRREFFGERFVRQEYLTVDNKKVIYNPGSDILCVLFWRAEEAVDPNTTRSQRQTAATTGVDPMHPVGGAVVAPAQSLENQKAYLKVLVDALASKPEIKFIEINTNSAAVSRDAVKDYKPTAPLVAAAVPQSGALQFVRLDVPAPFLAIIDKEGLVKYAGSAGGFMPAFILSHLTGAGINLSGLADARPQTRPGVEAYFPEVMAPPMLVPVLPNDPNRPVADPNQPRPAPQAQKQDIELPDEQAMQAEKKIIYARELFAPVARMPVFNYKSCVDACREIIRDYPGTKYAAEARLLLSKVPEKERATYNVTSEELGR